MSRPEPYWWAEARALRAQGLTLNAIAARLGVSVSAACYACNEFARENQRQACRAYWPTYTRRRAGSAGTAE